MRGWQCQPRKMVEYEHWQKNQAKMSIVGLSVAIWWCWKGPSRNQAAKSKHHFQPRPYEQFKVLSDFSLKMRCVSF
jgi:hypothetical protein